MQFARFSQFFTSLKILKVLGFAVVISGCNGLPEMAAKNDIKKTCALAAPLPTVSINISVVNPLPSFLSSEIDGATPFIDECNTPYEPGATLLRNSSVSASFITGSVSEYLNEFGDPLPMTKMNVKIFGRNSCLDPQVQIADIVDAPIVWGLYEVDLGDCRYKVWKGVVQ